MGDYLELQNGGPVKVRVHRRVLAGLEREASAELRGIVLGSASVENGEVLVEDTPGGGLTMVIAFPGVAS